MTERTTIKVHWSFWAIGVFMLIWNALGAANFFAQMNPEILEGYRESERAIIEGRPAWATVSFAVAVFGGTIGCLLLLLRSTKAYYVFVASLVGVILTIAHSLSVDISFGAGEIVGIVIMPVAVAAFLVWYTKKTVSIGWIPKT